MTARRPRVAGKPRWTEADLLDLQAAGQRQEHDIGLACHVSERIRAARLRAFQCGERGGVHIEGDDLAAVLLRHVAAHGSAHDPQPDEADDGKLFFRHGGAPLNPSTCRR